ncbi:MAG: hypothetical protein ACE5J7_01220 [Candidatus Aenigmatarchaeota archaeon]
MPINEEQARTLLKEYEDSKGNEKAYSGLLKEAKTSGIEEEEFRYMTWYLDHMNDGGKAGLEHGIMEKISPVKRRRLRSMVNRYRRK